MNPTAQIPRGQEGLAASISTMLAFDYITANWDRWSGANVARSGEDGPLLFVDNDGAFYEHPDRSQLATQLARLRQVVRFSKSFVSALRRLDGANLRATFGEESPGTPLLSDHVIADVESRMNVVLEVVDARIGRSGNAETLSLL
jgi:Golgi casein kinase Fam20